MISSPCRGAILPDEIADFTHEWDSDLAILFSMSSFHNDGAYPGVCSLQH